MRGVLRSAVIVVTVASVAVGCGDSSDPADDAKGAEGAPASGPEPQIDSEGEVTLAWPGPASQLDPHLERHTGERPFLNQLYDRLTYLDKDLNAAPMLATSWEFTDDGSALVMQLRDDVMFNDGTPFTAEAVKLSLERAKTLEGSTAAPGLEAVESIEVLGDHEVRLDLSGPAANLPWTLGTPAGAIISPAALEDGRDLGLAPGDAGSGPFVVEEFVPNDRTVFVRADDDYWDSDALHQARQTLISISESAPRMAALRSGEVNIILIKNDQAPEAAALDESGDFDFYQLPALLFYTLYVNNQRAPFDQVEVRKALNYAIDRETLASELLNGLCVPTEGNLWPENHWAYNPEIPGTYPYDPDEARKLLADAGLADGFEFTTLVSAGLSPQIEIAEAFQAQLAEIGVTMNIEPSESPVPDYQTGNYDAFLQNVTGQPDPSLTVSRHITGGYNAGFGSDEVAALAEQGLDHRLSQDERAKVYQELAMVATEQALLVPICFQDTMFLAAPNVMNVQDMSFAWGGIVDPRYLAVASE